MWMNTLRYPTLYACIHTWIHVYTPIHLQKHENMYKCVYIYIFINCKGTCAYINIHICINKQNILDCLLCSRYCAGPCPPQNLDWMKNPETRWWLGVVQSQATLGNGELAKLAPFSERFQRVLIFCIINGWEVQWKEWGRMDEKEKMWKRQFESFQQ